MGSRTNEQHRQLLAELNEERVAALTRIARTLESLITQLRELRDRIGTTTAAGGERDVAAYEELRARARQYRWYLEVQREALGMRRHEVLDEFYRIPEPLDAERPTA